MTAVIIFASILLSGCERNTSILTGPQEQLVSVDGEIFPQDATQRTRIRGGREDAIAVGRTILQGNQTTDKKWRSQAYFQLHYSDGHSDVVDVTKPENVVRINDKAFRVDVASLMKELGKLAK